MNQATPPVPLADATRLGLVRLQIADLPRSLAYYQETLGFQLLERGTDWATLGTVDGTPLVQLVARAGARPAPAQGRLGLYHFAILLPTRASLGRLIGHLAERRERFGASDHLVSEALYLRDPDGLGIEVYVDRPRSSWRRENGQVAMDTAPLDLESVVRDSAGARWTGMPNGTQVGHVHLHVGDLAIASDFYHAALGFERTVWSYPGALFLAAGGYHHHLGLNTWAGAGAANPRDDDARLLEWTIVLPSAEQVRETAARLERTAHSVERDAHGARAIDPWGTRFRIADEESYARLTARGGASR
ncbi:MAG TPA: VOC family protein [Usitatibacter sp.]